MDRLPFTDTHVHFYDRREPALTYSWLEPEAEDPELGDYSAIKATRYAAEDFVSETRFQNVERVIHMQAAIGTADPVEETRWLQAASERVGVPHGIVAYADLTAADLRATLDRHLAFPAVRGIRDFRYDDYLTDPAWEAGFGLLGELGLVCCDDPAIEQAHEVRRIADAHPGTTFCLDHAYFPHQRDDEYFAAWSAAVRTAAAAPSTVIKISGLGQIDHTWTVESLRRWVLTCIEAFGVDRTFFGTNWPVDRLFSSYGDVLDAYADLISEFTPDEQAAMFSGNARRVFRV
ncbi:MAG TPA: amidohydrolase family protein [Pseudolysinimonas sp.]|nr:amidohydrolase family protein [Pseudolysinimonas sp.]